MNYLRDATFIKSVFDEENIIQDELPIIVMVGKSNVGKSSFINTITNNSKMAKVGNTPGKTRCINYFLINKSFYLVDLPGYGYSTMSKAQKENIGILTNGFLESNTNIKHIFFILDMRNPPSADDKIMYEWLVRSEIPFTIILNKADKLSVKQQGEKAKGMIKSLFAKEDMITFSSLNKLNLETILKKIEDILK